MSARTVIVTRPEREALRWVRELRAQGVDAQPLPLIGIAPVESEAAQQALQQAQAQAPGYDALMFVSPNAVGHFLGSLSPVDLRLPGRAALPVVQALAASATRLWSPGPGTTEALRAAGMDDARIDAPAADAPAFDSEALWAQVAGQVRPGWRVLIVRGADAEGRDSGRAWLAERLRAAGAEVQTVAAYRRTLPPLELRARTLAVGGVYGEHVWLLSSAEAVRNLRRLLPGLPLTKALALATHPRIAEAAREAGFGTVHRSQPTLDAVVASIKSLA